MTVKFFSEKEWAEKSAHMIAKAVDDVLMKYSSCNIVLTGGRAAKDLYIAWSKLIDNHINRINFFWGDERYGASDISEINYCMAMETLFSRVKPSSSSIYRIRNDNGCVIMDAQQYDKVFPRRVDILLLSIGDDGHIASLFPNHPALFESNSSITHVVSPKHSYKRITITPRVIDAAHNIFVLARGLHKGIMYKKAIRDPKNFKELPARLALKGEWLLDFAARNAFMAD